MRKLIYLLIICIFFCSCTKKQSEQIYNYPFVYIEPGFYEIGSPADEKGRWPKGEEDERSVNIQGFYISKTEVTEEDYYSLIDPSKINEATRNLPVVNVSWLEALEYCNKKSIKENLKPVYEIPQKEKLTMFDISINKDADGYRLPSIDEWEIACRAGTRTPFYTGKKITKKQENFNSEGRTPIAFFPPNKLGLYDMSGNVCEWCWRNDYFTMYKGGSWRSENITSLRSSAVGFSDENYKSDYIGFRVIKGNEFN